MDISSLKEIGLTDGEVKVYLALLRLGSTKTGPLAAAAGVSSSKVYKILSRLEKKGLAGHAIMGGTMHCHALEPKRLLDYIDDEKTQLEKKRETIVELLPALEKQMKSARQTQATLYTGFRAISNFFRNILDELGKGDLYYVLGARYAEDMPEIKRFFYKYHQLRSIKGIRVNMLANEEIRDTIVPTTKVLSEIRFLPEYLVSNMQTVFYKNRALIIIWGADPVAFLVQSEDAVKGFKKYFDAFWKIAKK